jgi:hypothetical protein
MEKEIKISGTNNINILNLEPKITFTNELWVGKVKLPVNTELDFSGVHPLQHERVLEIANKIYNVNRTI